MATRHDVFNYSAAVNLQKPWDSSTLVKHSWHTAGRILNHSFCVAGFTAGCFLQCPSVTLHQELWSLAKFFLLGNLAKTQNVGWKKVLFFIPFHISVLQRCSYGLIVTGWQESFCRINLNCHCWNPLHPSGCRSQPRNSQRNFFTGSLFTLMHDRIYHILLKQMVREGFCMF